MPVLAEMVGTPVRPVQLVKIDVIGLKPLQAAVDGLHDGTTRIRCTIADPLDPVTGNLGRKDDLVPLARSGEPGSDDFLGPALCFRTQGSGGIKLGRVEEIHPAFDGVVHLPVTFGFRVLLAPGHGAEADLGNGHAGAAKRVHFHPVSPSVVGCEVTRENTKCKDGCNPAADEP